MAILITDKDYENILGEYKSIPVEQALVELLAEHNLKVATAESCTGGMISQKITNVSGASLVFDCGICSYSNEIKNKILGVNKETLNTVGAVSQETATQMAEGVKKLANSDLGLATTGIAGPTGGTAEKPVGLVYIGVTFKGNTTIYRAELCNNKIHTRQQVRDMASQLALAFGIKMITESLPRENT
jgi:PncC family amidohydrolase